MADIYLDEETGEEHCTHCGNPFEEGHCQWCKKD